MTLKQSDADKIELVIISFFAAVIFALLGLILFFFDVPLCVISGNCP
jgi:putative Ca2+/H+ antiporter (TMEM165/GDT1 family)